MLGMTDFLAKLLGEVRHIKSMVDLGDFMINFGDLPQHTAYFVSTSVMLT